MEDPSTKVNVGIFENNMNVNLFENLTKTFPADTTGSELIVMLMAVILSGVSVIPNYYFGGSFGKEFAQSIAKKYKSSLSLTELEYFRLSGALLSAIVNGCINGRSLNGAVWLIVDKGKEFKIPGNFGKAFLGLLGLLVLSGIATIPNYQFIVDTIKGWTKTSYIGIQVVSGLINEALNLRGTVALTNFVSSNVFGRENRQAASDTRKELITALNQKLPTEKKINDKDIELLSAGTLYRDKYPIIVSPIRLWTSAFMAAAPVLYDFGGYFFSAKEAMQAIVHTDEMDHDFVYYLSMATVCGVSTIAFAVKWGFLARANYDVTQHLFNQCLAEKIIPSNSPYEPPAKLKFLMEALAVIVGAGSLTGGFGLIEKYFFKNANTLSTNTGSIFITLIAGICINYKDFRDVSVKTAEEFFKTLDILTDYMIRDNRVTNENKFGKSVDDFIFNTITNIAMTGDNEILKRYTVYTEKRGNFELDLTQEDPDLEREGSDRLMAKKPQGYIDMMNEIEALSDEAYETFLSGNVRPGPSISTIPTNPTDASGSLTPSYSHTESEHLLTRENSTVNSDDDQRSSDHGASSGYGSSQGH